MTYPIQRLLIILIPIDLPLPLQFLIATHPDGDLLLIHDDRHLCRGLFLLLDTRHLGLHLHLLHIDGYLIPELLPKLPMPDPDLILEYEMEEFSILPTFPWNNIPMPNMEYEIMIKNNNNQIITITCIPIHPPTPTVSIMNLKPSVK